MMTGPAIRLTPAPGTYALLLHCPAPVTVRAGRLGVIDLPAGYWVYVGSAFGPGGLRARLRHHLSPSPRPHWHLDYVKAAMDAVAIWSTTDPVKREHDWATAFATLRGATCPVAGFGASDCACRTHLIHLSRRPGFNGFRRRIRRAIRTHGPMDCLDLME
ncbi:GIY-YIG nuclease family protein [Desulfosarcina ovata]|nr:GIY-YIG nuclease family protein [Desulfosarcina ovata]